MAESLIANMAPIMFSALMLFLLVGYPVAFSLAAVGMAVAFCGIIGFLGLVAPHCIRLMAGPDARVVLPGAALLGAALTVAADLVARLIIAPAELPIGVLTALIGAPFFLFLLLRAKGRMFEG